MPKINAGKYRHRITIHSAPDDTTRDTYGRRTGTGSTVATVWAEKTDWTGKEEQENNRETASVTTRFRIRHRTDVTPQMQVEHGTDVYDILSVLDFEGTNRELTLLCRKVIE